MRTEAQQLSIYSEEDILQIVRKLEIYETGVISYSTFLAGTLEIGQILK